MQCLNHYVSLTTTTLTLAAFLLGVLAIVGALSHLVSQSYLVYKCEIKPIMNREETRLDNFFSISDIYLNI